jgi:hypothetical protein
VPETIDLDAEDAKIVTLARSAQARTGAQEGAAVRDTDGRTYTGATVSLPSLAALHELGPTARVLVADQRGTVRDVLRAAR